MKEIVAIVNAYDALDHATTRAALATVVRVEGSSYRRTGARMLIADNGRWVGGISGGCLEGDALKRARLAIAQTKPTLVTYDTTDDDAYQIGVGLGCNGIIDVLITPLDPNTTNPVHILKSCVEDSRQTHVLLTVTNAPGVLPQGEIIRYEGRDSLNGLGDEAAANQLAQTVEEHLAQQKSAPASVTMANGQTLEVFVEVMLPVPQLVLMGQQYDVYPLVRLINELGWQAVVVANPQKVSQAMFAEATSIVQPDAFQTIAFDAQTAIVLMAHDYKTDKYNLPKALATVAPFIGILGPRKRTDKIFAELTAEGLFTGETDRIHAPVGLDIGAASPEEIALSIVAEVRAVLSGREGMSLRLRNAPIHDHP
ncbi:XdhC family protein [Spirosoma montaniterrae]|uniref:XshC-Cox1 family protein n=1 Tax=Spirosoma montaniterrae TaxID=1178516 RepID=A0A1P9WTW5_9BACT|nr:XdhC family protein [Spirosoma montaniterrae]AQG78814.1 XshC-Cox1 family protein [Spirosoma montaniterrae]